ncbi:MAG: metallophosphoesterase [Rhodospirillaceae bacterium]
MTDPNLREYATDRQWEILEAIDLNGSQRAAARALKIDFATVNKAFHAVNKKAAARGYSPEHDYKRPVPDGFKLRGVSSYYGKDGDLRGQWVKSQVDRERQEEILLEAMQAFASTLPRVEPTPAPGETSDALMACYPIGDHHLGMLAWDEETGGDNYDLSIGEQRLVGAIDHLVATMPPCSESAVVFLGDFLHYDGHESVTPASGHQLDSDSRFSRMVRVAIRCLRYTVEAAKKRHAKVRVIVARGNHDPASSVLMREALAALYEGEPRVEVDVSPRAFHFIEFGANLIGVHHGDKVKPNDLPLLLATDRPAEWGRTKYRAWWTGHVHHDQVKDFPGCTVESFRVLPPGDAWHSESGYRAMSDMKAILLHRDFGEVSRNKVNPAMLAAAG